jgi:hypothetical protein
MGRIETLVGWGWEKLALRHYGNTMGIANSQDPGPEEALGEQPLPNLPGAGGGWWPTHPPDCASGHLSTAEQWGQ